MVRQRMSCCGLSREGEKGKWVGAEKKRAKSRAVVLLQVLLLHSNSSFYINQIVGRWLLKCVFVKSFV